MRGREADAAAIQEVLGATFSYELGTPVGVVLQGTSRYYTIA